MEVMYGSPYRCLYLLLQLVNTNVFFYLLNFGPLLLGIRLCKLSEMSPFGRKRQRTPNAANNVPAAEKESPTDGARRGGVQRCTSHILFIPVLSAT